MVIQHPLIIQLPWKNQKKQMPLKILLVDLKSLVLYYITKKLQLLLCNKVIP